MKSLVFFLVTVCFPLTALADHGEIMEKRQYSNWQSFILSSESSACARMSTPDASDTGLLIIDFYPGRCSNGKMQIITKVKGIGTHKDPKKAAGNYRVDHKTIKDVIFTITAENDLVYLSIEVEDGHLLLMDSINGSTLRFRLIGQGNSKDVYGRFSLLGFTSAYNRSQQLCNMLTRVQRHTQPNSDSDFFKEDAPKHQPQQKKTPSKENSESEHFDVQTL